MKLFIDNNLPPRVAVALHALFSPDGHEVLHLKDKFPRNVSDEEWLSVLAEEGGWCVLTRDRGIRSKKHELAAWAKSDLTVFFLKSGWYNAQLNMIAMQLLRRWPEMLEVIEERPNIRGFVVPYKGRIEPIR